MHIYVPHQPELVSIKDALHRLVAGRSIIYRQMEAGVLQKRKIGRRTLFVRSDIDKLLAG